MIIEYKNRFVCFVILNIFFLYQQIFNKGTKITNWHKCVGKKQLFCIPTITPNISKENILMKPGITIIKPYCYSISTEFLSA